MASDGAMDGRVSGTTEVGSGFRWVLPSPSPSVIACLEASFPDVIRLPVAELEAEMESWQKRAVLVRSYHKWVPAAALIREFRRAGIQGDIAPISLAFRCHLFRFEDPNACDLILNRPWMVNGQVIGTEPWRPEFIPAEDAIPSALVWVRLPNLPMEFWKEEFIRAILEPAGLFICLDASTVAKSRGGFARACLRVDLRRPLRPGARVQGISLPFWQQFAFENLEGVCSNCGTLHLSGPCSQPSGSGVVGAESSSVYGPWIAAVRHRRVAPGPQRDERRKLQSVSSPGAAGSGSGSQRKHADPFRGAAAAEGWSFPAKVARRRVPSPMKEGGNSAKASRSPVGEPKLGCSVTEVVPGQGERAGFIPTEKVMLQAEKVGSPELGLNNLLLKKNPFASLGLMSGDGGLLDNRDVCPGPLKRARPVDYLAPRVVSKPEKRKGKGKAPISNSSGIKIVSSERLAQPSYSRGGGLDGVMSCSDRSVGFTSVVSGSDIMGSGSLSSVQSPRAMVDSVDPEAGSSLLAEGGTSSSRCLSDIAMVEDQGGVPTSSSL